MEEKNKVEIRYIQIDAPEVFEKFQGLLPAGSGYEEDRFLKIGAVDEADHMPVGIIVFQETNTSVDVEHFYVDEKYRLQGIGSALLELVEQYTLCSSKAKGRLLQLACTFDTLNEDLFRFLYERQDMDIEFSGEIYELPPETLKSSRILNKMLRSRNKDTSFRAAGRNGLELLRQHIKGEDADIKIDVFDEIFAELSQVVFKKGQVVGYLLARVENEEHIELEYLYHVGDQWISYINMVANAYETVITKYPQAHVRFTVTDQKLIKSFALQKRHSIGYMGVASWNHLPNVSYEALTQMSEK